MMQNKLMNTLETAALTGEKTQKIASFKGLDIYRIVTDKFKTNSINFFFLDNLNRENVTKNALIPAILRRGCMDHPTFRDIALRLEELYGASFDCGVSKKGECQVIQFYTEFMSDSYSTGDSSQFQNAFKLLYEIVTKPVLDNGVFKEDYVTQEKENLRKLIEGRINDKMTYSVEKCYEEMCSDEPYGIYEYGFVNDLAAINASGLYEKYREMIEHYPLQVFLCGDMKDEYVTMALNELLKLQRDDVNIVNCCNGNKEVVEVKNITDNMNVTQGKLTLGFRTNTQVGSSDYYPLVIYNGILGGGIHSKLFQNVREKASLAYYAYSRLEKFKELMIISSGIDFSNREKAQEIILKQMEEIANGNISDYEFDATMKTSETGIKSLMDNQMQIVDFYLSQNVAGTDDNFESLAAKLKKVTKQDVIEVSKKIKLDTIYFLNGKTASGGSNEN